MLNNRIVLTKMVSEETMKVYKMRTKLFLSSVGSLKPKASVVYLFEPVKMKNFINLMSMKRFSGFNFITE